MRVFARKSIDTVGILVLMLLFQSNLDLSASFAASLLPEGLVIKDLYEPGIGSPVGKTQKVQGEVVIVHKDLLIGYRAEKDLDLFKGDAIVTLADGRIWFQLNDGSVLTLAPDAKLVISRSIYDPKKKSRMSFLNVTLGKVRFLVKKLVDFKRSDVRVKTKTAVAGVRGSDFVTDARKTLTEFTTFEDTKLEVAGLAAPEELVLLTDFERTRVAEDAAPTPPEEVPVQEAEQMKQELPITAAVIEQEEGQEQRDRKAQKVEEAEEETEEKAEEDDSGEQGAEGGQTGGGRLARETPTVEVPKEPEILVSDDELVQPGELIGVELADELQIEEVIEQETMTREMESAVEEQEEAAEEQLEEEVKEPLPSFPGTPQQKR
jgi:hypothetical protein